MRRADRFWVQRGLSRNAISAAVRPRAFLLLAVLATSCLSLAQTSVSGPPADQQPDTLRGTVVNAVTGAPIARALVFAPGNSYAKMTDGEGHFEFAPPKAGGDGSFLLSQPRFFDLLMLSARKPGFLDEQNGVQSEPNQDGEITISLMPEALIKGRVIFSESDPPPGISVQLFSRQVQQGMPRWVRAGSTQVTSNGEFRFAELQPGTYKLMTDEALDNDPAITNPRGQQFGFAPVFYPGVADFAAAGSVQLTAGQTVQVDLPLTRQPYYPVRIPVANGDTNGGMNVIVSVQGHRGPGYSLGYNPQTGRIEGLLPRGNYLVEASMFSQNSSASGAVQLSVNGAATDGPTLTVIPNGAIEVHVVEQFTSTDSQVSSTWNIGGHSLRVHGPRAYLQVSAETEDDFGRRDNPRLRPPSSANDDSLVLENVAPGTYWLRLYSSRGYVAAATMGGLDLLHSPFTVAPGSSTPIEITMRDDSAELEGTIAGMATQRPMTSPGFSSRLSRPQAWVYCIPLSDSPGQFQQIGVSPDGKFGSQTMAPGAYRVLALRNEQPNLPYRDAEAMRAYENSGQVVHLAASQKVNVQLQAIPNTK